VLGIHLATSGVAPVPKTPWVAHAWIAFARNGTYGVTMFFVVSGFVITQTILKRDPDLARLDRGGFYVRRAGRILPLFLAVVAFGALALALLPGGDARTAFCLRDPGARFDGGLWVSLATFSFNWFRIARETDAYGFGLHWDVMWSLAIEEQFYFTYPLLLRGLASRRRAAVMLGIVVLSGPMWRAFAARHWPQSFLMGFTSSFACFDLIALGALLCLALDRRGPAPTRCRAGVAALGLIGAAGVIETYLHTALVSPLDRVYAPTLMGLSLVAFLWAAVRLDWMQGPFWSRLTYPGQLSYGGYLFHATTLFLLWPYLAGRSIVLGFAFFAISTFTLAAVVYHSFEVPVNRRVRSWLRAA
jgi:peptidoglycan/LPS O-acetylase OafA/YrhL